MNSCPCVKKKKEKMKSEMKPYHGCNLGFIEIESELEFCAKRDKIMFQN